MEQKTTKTNFNIQLNEIKLMKSSDNPYLTGMYRQISIKWHQLFTTSLENWIISVHVGKGADIGRPWLTVVELGSSNSIFVVGQFQHFVEGLENEQ